MMSAGVSYRKIILWLAVILILGAAFYFRDRVSSLLYFGKKQTSGPPQTVVAPAVDLDKNETSPILPKERSEIKKPPFPLYIGRDPEEVKPVPEEVKLFGEVERQKIFAAIGNYGKAVKENPDFFDGWIQLGLLKKMIGDFEGARDVWEYAGIIQPKNSVSFANLGELYWRYLPDFPKSEKNFITSIKNKPDDPPTYVSLSDLYFYSYKEKADLADDVLLEGIAANPKDVNLLKALASLYERQGKFSESFEWWQKVLGMDPNAPGIAATMEALKQKIAR